MAKPGQGVAIEGALGASRAALDRRLRGVMATTLFLEQNVVAGFTDDTGLFGELPELDSMAVATLLTAIEDEFGFVIEDSDIDADALATYGTLLTFVEGQLVRG